MHATVDRGLLRSSLQRRTTLKESVDLFRIGAREVDANPDGIDFSGRCSRPAHDGLFSREASLDPDGFTSRSAMDLVTQNMQSGMAYVWHVTQTNTRSDQIRAGQGLGAHQPGGDGAGHRHAAAEPGVARVSGDGGSLHPRARDAGAGGGTVQMWARLGYGPSVGPSPRWPLDAKIVGT